MGNTIEGMRVLITGGAKGIGAETARMFAMEGGARTIYLADIDDEAGGKTAKELSALCGNAHTGENAHASGGAHSGVNEHSGGGARLCECVYRRLDVADEVGVAALFREIEADGGLDVLFNCAGITSVKNLFETDKALWDRIMSVNVTSVFLLSKEAMRIMSAQKSGRIINVSSVSAYVGGIRTSPAYAASKAAILGLTRSLAKYGAPYNVTVNAVAPGIVDTDMTRDPDFVYSADEVPLGGAASPADIARTVLFLAGEGGNHITGQCINVNGGMFFA
ncbi:MAG: SDR family oxidoreductase [Oscillospiraceae bacterium]|nr:SDR family oxidoreductase [Oscillospiraceae bacterium]